MSRNKALLVVRAKIGLIISSLMFVIEYFFFIFDINNVKAF